MFFLFFFSSSFLMLCACFSLLLVLLSDASFSTFVTRLWLLSASLTPPLPVICVQFQCCSSKGTSERQKWRQSKAKERKTLTLQSKRIRYTIPCCVHLCCFCVYFFFFFYRAPSSTCSQLGCSICLSRVNVSPQLLFFLYLPLLLNSCCLVLPSLVSFCFVHLCFLFFSFLRESCLLLLNFCPAWRRVRCWDSHTHTHTHTRSDCWNASGASVFNIRWEAVVCE